MLREGEVACELLISGQPGGGLTFGPIGPGESSSRSDTGDPGYDVLVELQDQVLRMSIELAWMQEVRTVPIDELQGRSAAWEATWATGDLPSSVMTCWG